MLGHLRAIHEAHGLGVILIGEVSGEQDALDAEHVEAEPQRRHRCDAGRGDDEIVEEVLARQLGKLADGADLHFEQVAVVDALQPERNALAHVAEHDPELGIAIEQSRHDQAHGVKPGLGGEPPTGEIQAVVEIGRHHRRRGLARMEIDRHVLRLGGLEDRPILRRVEILPHRVGVDDQAAETELLSGPLDLPCRRRRILRRDRGEAREPRRIGLHRSRERVVRFSGKPRRQRRVEHLHARRGE